MDFKGIQVTIAVMARALINGRIDCKTAGQTSGAVADLLEIAVADSPRKNIYQGDTETNFRPSQNRACRRPRWRTAKCGKEWAANRREETRMAFKTRVLEFPKRSGWPHGRAGVDESRLS